jgi:hypothetical protein
MREGALTAGIASSAPSPAEQRVAELLERLRLVEEQAAAALAAAEERRLEAEERRLEDVAAVEAQRLEDKAEFEASIAAEKALRSLSALAWNSYKTIYDQYTELLDGGDPLEGLPLLDEKAVARLSKELALLGPSGQLKDELSEVHPWFRKVVAVVEAATPVNFRCFTEAPLLPSAAKPDAVFVRLRDAAACILHATVLVEVRSLRGGGMHHPEGWLACASFPTAVACLQSFFIPLCSAPDAESHA